ncbi:TfoX family protein [Mesorhizobium sp. M8A.F.Ca.ET.208.01.1.1]|uniref:TfoX/Sxy family protein n=1 Tax=unclassified Mesorhizobium TaxID=325217 RepID=UPI0010940B07|nr:MULTISPECIES: TfoX/Sxy family protein [unclassified Mesorhizobium]TGQ95298.1 TfoX family protein [Mesorhizobium sp. M8A.F.Ca.ET.208.01.1.1]TGT55789.1 TfoX family protein [Mesorhizobium sp. M8A.F.Ca.ET.167.01.1.1]
MDNERIAELFEGLGPVSIRKLFGGKGIYFDDVIIAVVIRGELMLKADEQSVPDFEAAGCRQWTYTGTRHGKLVAMPYWSIPDSAFDDPDEMAVWARRAYGAGRRAGK